MMLTTWIFIGLLIVASTVFMSMFIGTWERLEAIVKCLDAINDRLASMHGELEAIGRTVDEIAEREDESS